MNPTPAPSLASTLVRIAQKQAARYEAILARPNVDTKILQAECRMLVSVVRAVQSLQPRASSTKSAPPAAQKPAPAPAPKHQPAPQKSAPAPTPATAPKPAPPQVLTDPDARFGPQPGEPIITSPDAPGLTYEQRQARYSADLARATGFYKADELEAAARALGA